MPHLKLQSKADNLTKLSQKLTTATLLPQIVINYHQWNSSFNLQSTLEKMNWLETKLIIRSSATDEDNLGQSLAGRYLSLPNITGIFEVRNAIEHVFSSYKKKSNSNQIFIQPMISSPKIQGVAFSKEPNLNNAYFVINYTHANTTTDQITNGSCIDDNVVYIARYVTKHPIKWIQRVILLLKELEYIYQYKNLDIEFILTQENELILLQVRELYVLKNTSDEISIRDKLFQLKKNYVNQKVKSPIFGVMPDWNPAEILGIRPNTFALSLYKELITNEIWAISRKKYGYKFISDTPLLVDFYGMPYIDVKASFSSLIPNNLTKPLSDKLVSYYLEKLRKHSYLHDKIESEITLSSDHFTIQNKIKALQEHGFTTNERLQIKQALKKLTNQIICPEEGFYYLDLKTISSIEKEHQLIMSSQDKVKTKIVKIIDLCKNKGTLPFAGIARTAFIAKQYLNSLEELGVFTKIDTEIFNQSVSTTVHNLISHFNKDNKENFLSKFGHLRPDSYNLLSARYDDLNSNYFNWSNQINEVKTKTFSLSNKQRKQLAELLKKHSIPYQIDSFINFLRSAIYNRENAKFLFSRLLSDVLKLSHCLAKQMKYSKEDLAYLSINQLLSINDKESLDKLIIESKGEELIRKALLLPPIITDESNFEFFKNLKNQANFITLNSTTAKPVNLMCKSNSIDGSIILIKHADPGYDWIFTHKISGLITMYGGCNSHMAIRSGELNLPAAIGVGENAFNHYLKAKLLYLDCEKKWIKILK